MLTQGSFRQTEVKLKRFVKLLAERTFQPVGQANLRSLYQTTEPTHHIPADSLFAPVGNTAEWGGDGMYGWFKADYTVPEELNGKALFLYPHIGFYEATLWVNGRIHSNYAAKFTEGSHGNHYCNRITATAKAGERFDFALECYAYHDMPGTMPLVTEDWKFRYPIAPIDVCVRDDEIMAFRFDLETILSLHDILPEGSFRRAAIENGLYHIHTKLFYDPDACSDEEFRQGMRKANTDLQELLSKHNGDTTAEISLTGHSHMDTAWLWPIQETIKKCARTYANQMNLMDEYPEYTFIQSSAYHSEVIRRYYPELFERIQKAVAAGRYEPNGGVWVECDCNITGGEYMIRQFLWGQRFTRKYFHYTADCFWLPDTFGYSFAIPQIMKGCGIQYFLTTKMAWNDTNRFPYTSFYWQGLDGTRVLTHLNRTHLGPTPEDLYTITDGSDRMQEKRASNKRLFSYGKGDGGGGPEFEFIESARRLKDLEGSPRCRYQSVSAFMHDLEKSIEMPSTYAGEMYLELHRGTLTNQHEIKRNNRQCEIALHDLEVSLVMDAVRRNDVAREDAVTPLMETLLVRQFHDILPGTCIHSVHAETRRVVEEAIASARRQTSALLPTEAANAATLLNTLSFPRNDTVYLETNHSGVQGHFSGAFTSLDGKRMLAVAGVHQPAFGTVTLHYSEEASNPPSPFRADGDCLETPFFHVRFDSNGAIASMTDRRNGRELVGDLPFNTFLLAEDIPATYDNWDIDADTMEKFVPAGKLLEREIVANNAVELRIRSKYQLTERSTIEQDMVFDAATPLVVFDTVMNWEEEHRFLKAAFDTRLHADGVRNEIQFGCIRRSNHQSTEMEKARFEVCNHKYSDLSENSYGIALLNDGKYGLSVQEGSMRLSLHKGGMRPDRAGDKGRHLTRYAILVHNTPFNAESVVRPSYTFNYPPIIKSGAFSDEPLLSVSAPNVIIEAVKPCEDAEKAYILRLYEATGDYVTTSLHFSHNVSHMAECNMLEEEIRPADPAAVTFRPFEIKTLKVFYA